MTRGSDPRPPLNESTADDQDVAESLDSEVTGHEDDTDEDYPTDRALGVTDHDTTAAEEAAPESWERRSIRENPEEGTPSSYSGDPEVVPGLTEPDDRGPTEGELLGERADDPELPSAEEAAMHLTDGDA